jgi:hypothetical protein
MPGPRRPARAASDYASVGPKIKASAALPGSLVSIRSGALRCLSYIKRLHEFIDGYSHFSSRSMGHA